MDHHTGGRPTMPRTPTQTDCLFRTPHPHCPLCACCLPFAGTAPTPCADCAAAAAGTEADYTAQNTAYLGRVHAERTLALGPLHPDLARPLAVGRWLEQELDATDEVTARRLRQLYVDAFVATIQDSAQQA
jgi:hypothetical protein